MSEPSLALSLQAILFVAPGPLTVAQLAEAAGHPAEDVEHELADLATAMQDGGIRLSQLHGQYRLVSAPEAAQLVRRFLQEETNSELSKPALETLAIVAYRGPVTKSQIEAIRGVASETMLRNLLARGLILEAGKSQEPGRPMRYAISHSFLQHFGLTSAAELPPLPEAANEN
jgi:segregation and condensation protein B